MSEVWLIEKHNRFYIDSQIICICLSLDIAKEKILLKFNDKDYIFKPINDEYKYFTNEYLYIIREQELDSWF